MTATVQTVTCLKNLREFVNQTLCDHNFLEPDAYPLSEHILVRGDRPCGIFFCLHGPRAVKFTAVWDGERNTLLFYGCRGERILKLQLEGALDIRQAA
jgi:hypothetical protein